MKWPSFNGNFAIVLSPSRALSEDIGNDLLKQNVIESINFQPLPGDELKLSDESWNDEDDVVMWLMRMAFPKNETEFQEYLELAEKNEVIKIMRVTAPVDSKKDWDLYSRPIL